jgi:ribosomal protein S18 acetylase RimI-like enzyme
LPASSAPPLGPPSQFMAVDPALQRQGIGSALMAEAFRRLEARDAVLLWAVARDSAVAFYERFGFRAVDQSTFVPASTGRPHRLILLDLEALRPGHAFGAADDRR